MLAFLLAAALMAASADRPQTLHHIVLLEPAGERISVTETTVFRNPTSRTDSNGAFRFVLPATAKGAVRVTVTAPKSPPLERPARKTNQPDVYKVEFPLPPGETSFEIAYAVPLTSPAVFSGRTLYPDAPTRLVVPAGLALQGDGLESLGPDPSRKAAIYSVKGPQYRVEIQEAATEESGPTLDQIAPPGYQDRRWAVLGLTAATLLAGFVLHYRRRPRT